MQRIFLLRHGDTEQGVHNVCAGSTDVLLSDEGIRTSLHNIAYLTLQEIQRVVTSNMRRARLPGHHLNTHNGIPHHRESGFDEIHLGTWEGRPWYEIESTDGENLASFLKDPFTHTIQGAEPGKQFRERVLKTWNGLLQEKFDTMAIFAHGLVNSTILEEIDDSRWTFKQGLSCLNEIVVDNGTPRLIRGNVILYEDSSVCA